jgi:hypothetical protein
VKREAVKREVRITDLRFNFLPCQEIRAWFDGFGLAAQGKHQGGKHKVGRGTAFTASLPVRQQ